MAANWTKENLKKLIETRNRDEILEIFKRDANRAHKIKQHWETIAKEIEHDITGFDAKVKYNNMLRKYRDEKHLMMKSGAGRSTWKHFELMDKTLKCQSPKIPKNIFDTGNLETFIENDNMLSFVEEKTLEQNNNVNDGSESRSCYERKKTKNYKEKLFEAHEECMKERNVLLREMLDFIKNESVAGFDEKNDVRISKLEQQNVEILKRVEELKDGMNNIFNIFKNFKK